MKQPDFLSLCLHMNRSKQKIELRMSMSERGLDLYVFNIPNMCVDGWLDQLSTGREGYTHDCV